MPSVTSKFCPSLTVLLSFILIAPLSVSSRSIQQPGRRAGRRQDESSSEFEQSATGSSSEGLRESPSGTESLVTDLDDFETSSGVVASTAEIISTSSESFSEATSTESTTLSSLETSVTESSSVSTPSASSTESPSSTSSSQSSSESSSGISSSSSSSSFSFSSTSTRVSFVTSTPVVTKTVNESTPTPSSTSESISSTSQHSFSVVIKIPSGTASSSSPVTTLVVAPTSTTVTEELVPTTEARTTPTPLSAAANDSNEFWDNKSAVGGTFAVVALVIVVVLLFAARILWRRRRARAEMFDEKFVPFPPPATHYRDQSFGISGRVPSPTSVHESSAHAYSPDPFYDTAAYYDAESSDYSHTHESSFSAYPALAQARTNVYLPAAMTPSTASPSPAAMRPSTAQSQNPFADSNATFETSPFADPPQAGSQLRVPAPNAAYSAGRISSLYTASDADSFYGDSGARSV